MYLKLNIKQFPYLATESCGILGRGNSPEINWELASYSPNETKPNLI